MILINYFIPILYYIIYVMIFIFILYKIARIWRNEHIHKQMRIIRAILYRLSLAPYATEQEYTLWRNGNLQSINVGPECGSIYETVLCIFHMKKKVRTRSFQHSFTLFSRPCRCIIR